MKVMMISNTDGALYVFRRPIIDALLAMRMEVTTVSGASRYMALLRDLGVDAREVTFPRHSISLLTNVRLFLSLRASIIESAPDIVHCFTHKAAIFGSLAARLAGVKRIFVTVTGLGTLYATNSLRNRVLRNVLRLQYWFAMRYVSVVFFQNPDDQAEFVSRGLVDAKKARLTGGSGVDLTAIKLPTERRLADARAVLAEEIGLSDEAVKIVLLPARAVAEKGVAEFYQAAKLLNDAADQQLRFVHIGLIDDLSEGPFSRASISQHCQDCGVHYLGFKNDVLNYLTAADIVVLPSYREGMPRSLLEALALGKIIVTTDVPGCRETVVDGWNGYLCVAGSAASLAAAVKRASINIGPGARERSRSLAEEKFDSSLLVNLTLKEYGIAGE